MQITAIRAYRRDIPLTNPYTIAFQTTEAAELAFVEIELANGIIGFGSSTASEHVFGESLAESMQNLQSDTVQQWVGRDIRHFDSSSRKRKRLSTHTRAPLLVWILRYTMPLVNTWVYLCYNFMVNASSHFPPR